MSQLQNEHSPAIKTHNLPLIALCLGFFMIIMDATIINPALPYIERNFSATISNLQWVTAAYTLIFACLLLSAGSLGDKYGSRQIFMTGLYIFTISSVICGAAQSMQMLIIARIVQGVGAAMTLPTSLALINAVYSDRQSRARAIGVWSTLGGIAAGLGPVLGGILTEWINWRSIFYINLPIGIASVILTKHYVQATSPVVGQKNFDLAGQLSGIIAVATLIYALIEGHQLGWDSAKIWIAFIITASSVIVFILVEKYSKTPLLPLKFFANSEFSGSMLVGAIINTSFYGELFLLALYFHNIQHYSALMTGFAMLPQSGISCIAAYFSGKNTARFGPRPVMLTGLSLEAIGMLGLTQSTAHIPYWFLIMPLLAVGFGTTYTMPAATAATIEAVPSHLIGTASGILNASRQIGSALGVAIFGGLIASAWGFMSGYHISSLIGAFLSLIGVFIALICVPKHL